MIIADFPDLIETLLEQTEVNQFLVLVKNKSFGQYTDYRMLLKTIFFQLNGSVPKIYKLAQNLDTGLLNELVTVLDEDKKNVTEQILFSQILIRLNVELTEKSFEIISQQIFVPQQYITKLMAIYREKKQESLFLKFNTLTQTQTIF